MNGSPPPYPHQTPPRPARGGSCFLKGCLTVVVILMLLGVVFGGTAWYLWHSAQPFLTHEPAIHPYQGGPAAYAATAQKLAAFNQTLAAGQKATVSLTGDDLNALVAHDPQLSRYRDRVVLSIENNQIVADTSFPLVDNSQLQPDQRLFFSARFVLDASYSSGDFAFLLARLETLKDHRLASPLLLGAAKGYVNAQSQTADHDFHDHPEQFGDLQPLTAQVHTIILQNNQLVATSVEHPKPTAAPDAPPVANPPGSR